MRDNAARLFILIMRMELKFKPYTIRLKKRLLQNQTYTFDLSLVKKWKTIDTDYNKSMRNGENKARYQSPKPEAHRQRSELKVTTIAKIYLDIRGYGRQDQNGGPKISNKTVNIGKNRRKSASKTRFDWEHPQSHPISD